jgi:hypothetical protein
MIEYVTLGLGATDPGTRLISLGIETVVSDPTLVINYYNWLSVILLAIIALSASQFDAKFISILIPIWAGFELWAGWLYFPNQSTGYAVIVVCAMIAIMTYMQETRHEKYGIAGPGNTIVKIFTFLIVLQSVVVFVNSAQIFPSDTVPVGIENSQYATIDLAKNMGVMNSAGGLTADIVDTGSILLQTGISVLLLLGKLLLSIAFFSVILAMVFPWIVEAGVIGTAFLVVIQIAIWVMYALFIFALYYKPSPDPGW